MVVKLDRLHLKDVNASLKRIKKLICKCGHVEKAHHWLGETCINRNCRCLEYRPITNKRGSK